jgi:NTE family protein
MGTVAGVEARDRDGTKSMSLGERGRRTREFIRATSLFARTVYTELKSAGYSRDDVLAFVNELMALLSKDLRSGSIDPPSVFDPEAGTLDKDTIHEILDFELKRARRDRRSQDLVLVSLDVLVPDWMPGPVRTECHDLLARELASRLRAKDSLGRLGPGRYLILLPQSKEGVVPALKRRIKALLLEMDGQLPDGLRVELRWVRVDSRSSTSLRLLQDCLSKEPENLCAVAKESKDESGRRIGRALPQRDREVVLALGGGAARAVSHAGVLKSVSRARLKMVGIAGCSGGALVGAMYARGVSPDEIVERFTQFSSTKMYRAMRRAFATFLRDSRRSRRRVRDQFLGESSLPFYSESKVAAVPQDLLEHFVEYFVGPDCDMSSLPIPLAVAATDLVDGGPIVLSHGSLHAALSAATAVPGLFPLQRRGDRLLADGSALCEIPIGAAHVLGAAAPVLAIHLEHPSHTVERYRSSAEIVSRIGTLIHRELLREQLRLAKYLISIPVQDIGWLEFHRAEECARVGERVATQWLGDWFSS